jgi:hypothetical protein
MAYKPITVESAVQAAKEAREKGYGELADVFLSIANKVAWYNENHEETAEQLRQRVGDSEFFAILFNEKERK